jgi:hypothetical protein
VGRAEDGGRPLHVSNHVAILSRGYRFTLEGRSFVSLGGAPFVDLEYRNSNKDWWAEEAIRPEDVAGVIEGGVRRRDARPRRTSRAVGGPAIAHIRTEKEGGWPDHALAYARVGAELMHEAFLGVRPSLRPRPAYHVIDETTVALPDTTYETRIWALNCDGVDGNVRYLDLATLDDPTAENSSEQ